MILVCVGASEFPFDRLLEMIEVLCNKKIIDGKDVIAQIGVSNYKSKFFQCFSLIGRDEFQKYVREADIVITHAGTGSVIPALKLGKKVIVVPRREEFNEHIDNHQKELADIFTQKGFTLCAENYNDLKNAILNIDKFSPERYVSNNMKLSEIIIDFIEA